MCPIGEVGKRVLVIAAAVCAAAALPTAMAAQNIGVFTTDAATDGDIGGLAGGDAFCNEIGAATFPGSGPWVAWLSAQEGGDPPVVYHARDRIPTPGMGGAYVRAAQPTTVIATDLGDLTDGSLANAIELTELGAPPAIGSSNFTGTSAAGLHIDRETCFNWTTNSPNVLARVGDLYEVDGRWTESGLGGCDSPRHLYCFGPLPEMAPALPLPAGVALAVLLLLGGGLLVSRRSRAAG